MFSNINTTLGRWTINKLSTSTQICSPNIAEDWRGSKICNPDPAEAFSYQILAPLHASSLIGRLLWSGLWLAGSRLQWHSKVYYSIAITACPTHITSVLSCSLEVHLKIQLKNTAMIYTVYVIQWYFEVYYSINIPACPTQCPHNATSIIHIALLHNILQIAWLHNMYYILEYCMYHELLWIQSLRATLKQKMRQRRIQWNYRIIQRNKLFLTWNDNTKKHKIQKFTSTPRSGCKLSPIVPIHCM